MKLFIYIGPILSILAISYVLDRVYRKTRIAILKGVFKGLFAGFIFTIFLYSGIIFLSCFDSEYMYKLLEFTWPPIHFLIELVISQLNLNRYFHFQTFSMVFYICLGVAQWMLLGMFLDFVVEFVKKYKNRTGIRDGS